MPRFVDLHCPNCGFTEEVQKDVSYFEEEGFDNFPCPKCGFPERKEKPSIFNVQKTLQDKKNIPRIRPSMLQKTPPANEVRKIIAKELFDACSHGSHVPADIENCETDHHEHD